MVSVPMGTTTVTMSRMSSLKPMETGVTPETSEGFDSAKRSGRIARWE